MVYAPVTGFFIIKKMLEEDIIVNNLKNPAQEV